MHDDVSMVPPLSGQIGFQISNTVTCFWRTWFARLPDLAVLDYYFWGHVKSKVYGTGPANIANLKHRFQECFQGAPKEMLQRLTTTLSSRMQECIERHGGHIQSVIFEQ